MSKQIIFRVELQYGDIKWVIRRTVYDFYKLHLTLAARGFDNLPKFPSQVIVGTAELYPRLCFQCAKLNSEAIFFFFFF